MITEIKVIRHNNINIKILKLNSFEIKRDKNKTITFEFLLKDSEHNGYVNQIQIIESDF